MKFGSVSKIWCGKDSFLISHIRLKVLVRNSSKSTPKTQHRCARIVDKLLKRYYLIESMNVQIADLLQIEIIMQQ